MFLYFASFVIILWIVALMSQNDNNWIKVPKIKMEISPSWSLRTGDAWPTIRPCRMAQTAQSQRPTHSIVIRLDLVQSKEVLSRNNCSQKQVESEQIETSCFKYLNLIHFNLLVIKKNVSESNSYNRDNYETMYSHNDFSLLK